MKKFFALLAVAVLVAFAAPAFAANPFVDVPMNHWSYDALSQLAAKGVIQGYPDGSFKGNQPMTRYEMATAVARALATVDMDKASKEDVEMLKRLVVEFKDELDALGVKVDELDERVAVLEKNLGGWRFYGELRFTAEWADEENQYSNVKGDTEFDLDRYRLWMTRKIDDKMTVILRLGAKDKVEDTVGWERYYAEIMFPWDFKVWIGKWWYNWEADDKIINDGPTVAWVTDNTLKGFYAKKNWGNGYFSAFVSHKDSSDNKYYSSSGSKMDEPKWDGSGGYVANPYDSVLADYYLYGARFNFNFNDRFRMALSGILRDPDEDYAAGAAAGDLRNTQQSVYWADFTVNFTPGFSLIGAYFLEDLDEVPTPSNVKIPLRGSASDTLDAINNKNTEDSPNAYKVVLNVDQSVLKFTSIWAEYAHFDEGWQFFTRGGDKNTYGLTEGESPYNNHFDAAGVYLPVLYYVGSFETDVFYAYLRQKWSDKINTFVSYADVSYDDTGKYQLDTQYWTVGVDYWYTPTVKFTLSYDDASFDDDHKYKDDSLIRFRTWIFF